VLVAVRQLAEEEGMDVTVDAVGGASAGALVAVCAAHCLLEGIDPVHLMHEAWVEGVSLRLLRGRDARAPLSFDSLRERIPGLLDPTDGEGRPIHRRESRQESPVTLHVALTGLRGLSYPVRGLREDRPITAATYADWSRFELAPGGGVRQLLEPEGNAPLDYVLASAAHPGGFAPRLLDRSGDRDEYAGHGIEDFPDSAHLWYTDGGLLQSQPLGRVVAAAHKPRQGGDGGEARYLTLLIDPRSEAPSGSKHWSDPELDPTWQAGLARALAILPAQTLYEDLRRIEKDNWRLGWAEELVEALVPHLDEGARDALQGVLEQLDADRGELRADEPDRERARSKATESDDAASLLRRAVAEVAGLFGKHRVEIDAISPLVLADESGDVAGLLAGELIGDFGGFLSRDLRASDFGLGYDSALRWATDGLPRCGVEERAAERAVRAVEDARLYRREDVDRGGAQLSDLPLAERLELGRLVLQAGRVLVSGAVDVRSRMRDPLGRAMGRVREVLPARR
jgi:predicted acylesterase/phospholipase RssA